MPLLLPQKSTNSMEKTDRFLRLELVLDPVLPAREVAVAYLNGCGFSMFEEAEKGLVAFARESEWDERGMEGVIGELQSMATVQAETAFVESENWNAQWESEYPEVVIEDEAGAPRCTIRAPFHHPPVSGLDVVVAPQMSFGTGHHATTHLMSERLLDLSLAGAQVLDMGCGTGVLALVAARLGASQVLGIDIERNAVLNARDNVTLNLELKKELLTFELGDGSACDALDANGWDVICANIQKNVLAADMARYARVLAPGGSLLLSGFLEGDVPDMRIVIEDQGLQCLGVTTMEGWACMHCGKPLKG